MLASMNRYFPASNRLLNILKDIIGNLPVTLENKSGKSTFLQMRFRHSLPTPPTPTCSDGHYDGYSPMYDSAPHQTVETCHYGSIVAVFNLKPITKQDLSCSQACFLKPKLCLQQDQMWRLSSYSVFKGESTKKFLFQTTHRPPQKKKHSLLRKQWKAARPLTFKHPHWSQTS